MQIRLITDKIKYKYKHFFNLTCIYNTNLFSYTLHILNVLQTQIYMQSYASEYNYSASVV